MDLFSYRSECSSFHSFHMWNYFLFNSMHSTHITANVNRFICVMSIICISWRKFSLIIDHKTWVRCVRVRRVCSSTIQYECVITKWCYFLVFLFFNFDTGFCCGRNRERERENVYVINLYYFIRQPNNLDYVVRYYEKWFAYARSIIIRG